MLKHSPQNSNDLDPSLVVINVKKLIGDSYIALEYNKTISHPMGYITNKYPYSSDDGDGEYIDRSQDSNPEIIVYVLFV